MQDTKPATVQEIFASDVTRDIPPVIYFHEQQPEKLKSEVEEYIITGGYEENDPRRRRIADGIHEQFVRLLKALHAELAKPGGTDLPGSWISGFFGSGKSSFAKLLGLALDQRKLPDGQPLAQALLERDDSPRRAEFREAWERVVSAIDPIAVVFDIGAVARDDEHIHSAAKRQLFARLDYCSVSHNVAEYELKLEQDGHWDEFLKLAEETLGKPWSQAKNEQLAEDSFSEVMHALFPNRYADPMAWLDFRTGSSMGGSSVEETSKQIEHMISTRAKGQTLFFVVDEVSQYIHQNDTRMLKLDAFVKDLGQRLKGRVWVLATGQQKLEEDVDGSNLSKLKDRFPPRLRAHLSPTNIRDVVHKRLLKKKPAHEEALRELFEAHRSDLKLNAYKCGEISDRDFLEVYPMLPAQVDLLMQITSNLRARSSRMKGDDHAIRGLLQLLGELFREQKLGEKPFGTLVTVDQIYDVQATALDADVQNTMARLQASELAADAVAMRAAKAVALLELISEQEPTTAELVAQCLYPRMGHPSEVETYRAALERLFQGGFLANSEKQGYKIQSSAGQEWANERDSYSVTGQQISELVKKKLHDLMGSAASRRPRYMNKGWPLASFYSDSRGTKQERLSVPSDPATVTFDFHFVTRQDDRFSEKWLKESDLEAYRDRILWISGATSNLESKARDLVRSRHMVERYLPRLQSLPEGRKRFLFDEQTHQEHLETEVAGLVARAFTEGALYFRARQLDISRHGAGFVSVVCGAGEEVLPLLYPHHIEIAITDGELKQLLEENLSGVSAKFLEPGLGILRLDAGKYVPACDGEVVTRVRQYIESQSGISGAGLLQAFGGPPSGYPSDVVKACVLGLLRGGRITLRPTTGEKITSVRDPNVRELFLKDKDFRKADLFPKTDGIDRRSLIPLRHFFKEVLQVDFEMDNDHIADAVFRHFPKELELLNALHRRVSKLESRPRFTKPLEQLGEVLQKCLRSRLTEETLLTTVANLDALRDGLVELRITLSDLSEENLADLAEAQGVLKSQGRQLQELGGETDLEAEIQALREHLEQSKPWLDIKSVGPVVKRLRKAYIEQRQEMLEGHDHLADELREAVKRRDGFATLETGKAEAVLRPIRDALCDTTASKLEPSLVFLRDSVPAKLHLAGDEANRRLDAMLADAGKVQVVQVKAGLAGRELSSPQDVEALLDELRERLLAQLKNDVRIRLL